MSKLHIRRGAHWRSRHQTCVLIRVLGALLDIRIELQDLNHGLWISGLIFFCQSRSCEKFLPFRREADKVSIEWVKANVDTMSEVSRVANTGDSRTMIVNGILPVIQLTVVFKSDQDNLSGSVATLYRYAAGGIGNQGQLDGHRHGLGTSDTYDMC